MTKKEAVSLLEGEIIRCRMAPKINGCPMTEEWQRTIEVCQIAIDAIREQEQRRWIPVTERLPEKDGSFMCTYKFNSNSEMQFVGDIYYFASDKYQHWQLERSGVIVTHWMPLPEPQKEGAD